MADVRRAVGLGAAGRTRYRRPGTVIVGAERDAAWPYFGFAGEPGPVAEVDLGGRVLDCLATPGHHEAAVTYYDRYTGILLTGDTVYPGRLYVFDWPGFVRSIDRPAGWYPLFPNPVVAESLLDRLINTSHQVFMNGPSYRPSKRPGRVIPTRKEDIR